MSLVGFTLLGSIEAPTLTGTATGVPLLVKPNTEFTAAMLLNLDVGGGDLRFSSDAAGLNQLPCEIVDGLDVVWVKPTGVSISTGATLYVWGDNTGASQPAVGDAFGRDAVWVDYEAVLHMSETGTNGVFADSTGNGYDTTLTTGTLGTTTIDNPFGLSWPNFDTSQVVKLTSSYAMLNNTAYSVSMWWNADVSENFNGLFGSRYKSPSDSNYIQITSDGRPSNNPSGFINVSQSANVTRLLKIKCDSSSLQLMTDGVQLGVDTTVSIATNNTQITQDFRIGSYYDDGAIRRYDGNVGEIRVKKTKDVDVFDSIEYDNQSATGPWWIAADTGGAITVPATLGTISYTGQSTTVSITGSIDVAATLGTIAYTSNNATVDISGSVDAIVTLGAIDYTSNNTTVGITGSVDVITTLGTIDYSSSNVTVDVTGSVDALATLGAITYTSVSPIVSIGGAIVVSSTLGTITYSSNDTVISLQGVVSVPATLGTISYSSNDAVVSLAGLIDVNATLGTISYTSDNTTVTVAAGQSFGVVGVGFADDIYGSTFKPDSTTVNFRG